MADELGNLKETEIEDVYQRAVTGALQKTRFLQQFLGRKKSCKIKGLFKEALLLFKQVGKDCT